MRSWVNNRICEWPLVTRVTGGVPGVITAAPRHDAGEGGEYVVDAPGDEHAVVDGHQGRHGEHRPTDTCETTPTIGARL